MRRDLPAIAKAAARVRAALEESVNLFPRAHRYGVGSDLRNSARQVARLTFIAWRDRSQQLNRVEPGISPAQGRDRRSLCSGMSTGRYQP
jgi:hypothetical protein